MGSLEIRHLSKQFGANTVLSDINLTVPDGEFFVVLGPSGGGKSTLLRILCGIETADSGEIILDGRNITKLPPRDRDIGMVFQDYGLYPHMNARANIAYGMEARGTPKAVIEERIQFAADKLGITPLLDRVVVDLSGGEQQRVALARALAKDARLYLFDEPLSNLDPKLRVKARRDILMVHREKRKPTLYVTHDQTEALASGDRIGIIARGRLQQVGAADDLIQRPANLFVAGFIGSPSMNLVEAVLKSDGAAGGHVAQIDGQYTLPLPARWTSALRAANLSQVVIGIPPTAIVHADSAAPGEAHGAFEAVVDYVDALVGEIMVTVQLPTGRNLVALFQGMDETEFAEGRPIRLSIDADQVRLFNPATEAALAPDDE